ncbi:MAG: hypothetical protein O2794_03430 [bacterium]|nr:hypothetical protein [bacterium]
MSTNKEVVADDEMFDGERTKCRRNLERRLSGGLRKSDERRI